MLAMLLKRTNPTLIQVVFFHGIELPKYQNGLLFLVFLNVSLLF